MTIAPIRHSVSVRVPPARAFTAFAEQIGLWWPKTMTIGATPAATIIIEPRQGGRWFERGADGAETDWGHVLAWDPPGRLLIAWQIGADWSYDPALVTEVELTFAPQGDGTLVTLEHRHLERYGDAAAAHAAQLDGGWPSLLQGYAAHGDGQSPA